MSPEDVIKRIAEVATSFAWHSNTGGMETAGMIVSYLALHPENTERFLVEEGSEFMLTGECMPENGCLTFHRASDGKVTTPQELRAAIRVKNMERGRDAEQKRGNR